MEGGRIKIGAKNVDCRHKCGRSANLQNGFQSHKYKTRIQILIQTKTKNRVKKSTKRGLTQPIFKAVSNHTNNKCKHKYKTQIATQTQKKVKDVDKRGRPTNLQNSFQSHKYKTQILI